MCMCIFSFADVLDVMNRHITILTNTVSLDLTYFSTKFIESGFMTQSAAHDVLTKLGVSDRDKASQLLHLITENFKISLKKRVWAEKLIAVFSSQAAYSDLATTLSRDIFPGIVDSQHHVCSSC